MKQLTKNRLFVAVGCLLFGSVGLLLDPPRTFADQLHRFGHGVFFGVGLVLLILVIVGAVWDRFR